MATSYGNAVKIQLGHSSLTEEDPEISQIIRYNDSSLSAVVDMSCFLSNPIVVDIALAGVITKHTNKQQTQHEFKIKIYGLLLFLIEDTPAFEIVSISQE